MNDVQLLVCCAQVETNKEKSLPRRVQSLQRFLLERLRSELAQRRSQPPPGTPLSGQQQKGAAKNPPHPKEAADGNAAGRRPGGDGSGTGGPAPDQAAALISKASKVDGGGEEVVEMAEDVGWPSPEQTAAGLDGLFGVLMQQRIRCLYGEKAETTQDILSFQVGFLMFCITCESTVLLGPYKRSCTSTCVG